MPKPCLRYILLGIVGVLLVSLSIERIWTPTTTATDRAAAHQYGVAHSKAQPPRPFHFDGCTLFPDRVFGTSFRTACRAHDIAYWYGGSAVERVDADQRFKGAIAEQGVSGALLQYPMYAAVRLLGNSIVMRPLNANWGFGYNDRE